MKAPINCIFLFLLISYFSGAANTNGSLYLKGYVVTSKGDTLWGKIKLTSSKIFVIQKSIKKPQKFKKRTVIAYKHGNHTYQNHHGFYRLVVNGPAQLLIKDVFIYNAPPAKSITNTYYCVKRADEIDVTILYVNRRVGQSNYPISQNILLNVAAQVITDMAVSNQLAIFKDMTKVATEYFKDCPILVADLEAGKYASVNDIHKLVEHYNYFVKEGKAGQ